MRTGSVHKSCVDTVISWTECSLDLPYQSHGALISCAIQVAYRFVSVLNEQGFIEGRYVPVVDGKTVVKQAADGKTVVPVDESAGPTNGDAATSNGQPKTGEDTDSPATEPASSVQ